MEVIWALSKSLACSRGLVKNFTFPIIEQTNHNISPTLLSGYINMKNRFRNKTLHFLRLGLILFGLCFVKFRNFPNLFKKNSIWKMLPSTLISIWILQENLRRILWKKIHFHLLFMFIFVTGQYVFWLIE